MSSRAIPAEYSYDALSDVFTFDGYKFAGELLRTFTRSPCGTTLRIVERKDGVITVSLENDPLASAAPDMLAAMEAALPIMIEDMSGGYERDDGKDAAAIKMMRAAVDKARSASR